MDRRVKDVTLFQDASLGCDDRSDCALDAPPPHPTHFSSEAAWRSMRRQPPYLTADAAGPPARYAVVAALPLALQLPGLFTGHPGPVRKRRSHTGPAEGGTGQSQHPCHMVQDGHQDQSLAQGNEGGGLQVTPGWALAEETWTTAGYLARDGFGLGTAIQEGCSGGKGDGPRGEEPGNCP